MNKIKNFYYRLLSFKCYLSTWGVKGISIYKAIRSQKEELLGIELPLYKAPIFLRSNSSDVYSFEDIFAHDAYRINEKVDAKVILDCGANVGHASVYFAQHYPTSKIIAVEPNTENVELIIKNSSAYPSITCEHSAIWNKPNYLKIENENASNWAFRVVESTESDPKSFKATSIQAICEKYHIDKIDILKMDIEGAEAFVFDKHSMEWLKKTEYIIIELHDRFQENCSKHFFEAMSHFKYTKWEKGENIFVRLHHN